MIQSVNVIAFREEGWMDRKADFRQWDCICRAFNADLQLITSWDEAKPKGHVVICDQTGLWSLEAFSHPKEVTYVFGRTAMNKMQASIPFDSSVCIYTPAPISLFGVEAASMVLYDRMVKSI